MKRKKTVMQFDDFLNHLKLEADSQLKKEDSKEFLSEINFLKSLNEEELTNFLKDSIFFKHPVLKFIRLLASSPPESLSTQKVDSILNSLKPVSKDNESRINLIAEAFLPLDPLSRAEVFKDLRKLGFLFDNLSKDDVTRIIQKLQSPSLSFDLLQDTPLMLVIAEAIFKRSRRLYKGQEFLSKWFSLNAFLLAHEIKARVNLIRNKYLPKRTKNRPLPSLFQSGYALGVCRGAMELLDTLKNPFFQQFIHNALSSTFVSRRYTKEDARHLQAQKRAHDRWKNGNTLWHHEMAKDLREKEGFSDIEYDKLKTLLLPVAVPYKKDYQFERMKKRNNTVKGKTK